VALIRISVVLPVRNEAHHIAALLQALEEQDFPPDQFEILVADARSTDGTRACVQRIAANSPVPILLIDNPGIRSGAGRNAGISQAKGEYILFIDGHCSVPSTCLLRDTIAIFEHTGADCLCRPQPLAVPTLSETGRAIAAARSSLLGHGRDSLIYDLAFAGYVDPASSGASYRRKIFEEVGGYDERFDACEDVDFNIRVKKLGKKAYTDPRLAIHYAPRESIRTLAHQMLRYGRGRIRLAVKHPDSTSWSQFVPLACVVVFLWAACAIWQTGFLRSLPFYLLAIYMAILVAGAGQLLGRHGIAIAWRSPVIYLAIHLGLGAGMLTEAASMIWRRMRSAWFGRPDGLRQPL
jgi:succinoglycan biosynthesis protein ExoA